MNFLKYSKLPWKFITCIKFQTAQRQLENDLFLFSLMKPHRLKTIPSSYIEASTKFYHVQITWRGHRQDFLGPFSQSFS